MKNLLYYIVLICFSVCLLFLANKSYSLSLSYESQYKQYAQDKSLQTNAQVQVEKLLNNVLSSLLNIKDDKKEPNNVDKIMINELKNKTLQYFLYFIIVFILSLFTYFFVNIKIVLSYLHIISIMTLFFGIFSPIFLMYVTSNFVNSEIILQFESSNIISSINKLFVQDNYFVAGIIFIFSILFPLLKTIISFISIYLNEEHIISRIRHLMSKINKFSMADVFVLSIFLVYLSPNKQSIVKTELQIGFYFFFSYVIISILISLINNKNKQN